MFLIDTATLSELEKPSPNPGVTGWFESVSLNDLYLSVMTVAELWQGIILLPQSRQCRSLEVMFSLIPDRFSGRVLQIDWSIAEKYAELQADFGPLPIFDAFIAATAVVNRLTIISRNVRDFARTGASIHDPWT
jgi:predicted nucleic acid-binding protein